MRTGASFRVHGPDLERVTRALSITPTRVDRVWSLTIPAGDETELDVPLTALLDVVERESSALDELRGEGYGFDFFCYVGSHATEHALVLQPDLLRRVADLGAQLWFDVYSEAPNSTTR